MFLLRILLYPFAILYNLVTTIRNYLYDRRLKPATRFDVPVVSIGNLSVGGTGKTPMIEHLIRLLTPQARVATLSRGYKRSTKGVRLAGADDNATTLGDEPFQFYRKFGDAVVVAVSEDRALGIPAILDEHPDVQVVLLDDAFQHRRVIPAFSILLTDYNRLFYDDFLLPAGRLRESREGAARADIVVVTKCPLGIKEDEMIDVERQIRQYADKPVFFSTVRYGRPVAFGEHSQGLSDRVVLVSGIANAAPLKRHIKENYKLVSHLEYGDHHAYTAKDIEKIRKMVQHEENISVVSTEKDMVKINTVEFRTVIQGLPLFYLPIEVSFIKSGEDFDAMVKNILKK